MKSKSIHQCVCVCVYIYIYIYYLFNHLATSIIHDATQLWWEHALSQPMILLLSLAYFHWGKTNFSQDLSPPYKYSLSHHFILWEPKRLWTMGGWSYIWKLAYPPQNSQSRTHHPMLWSICTCMYIYVHNILTFIYINSQRVNDSLFMYFVEKQYLTFMQQQN